MGIRLDRPDLQLVPSIPPMPWAIFWLARAGQLCKVWSAGGKSILADTARPHGWDAPKASGDVDRWELIALIALLIGRLPNTGGGRAMSPQVSGGAAKHQRSKH